MSPRRGGGRPTLPRIRRMHSAVLEQPLAVPRLGVMLHYDDSASDAGALAWFKDARCRNGYTWLVLDDGEVVELADPAKRTPHAGVCRTPNANSVFYGIAAATDGATPATAEQVKSIVRLCAFVGRKHGWAGSGEAGVDTAWDWIRGHDAEATWSPALTRAAGLDDARGRMLWGQTGRKVDPTGVRADGVPVLSVREVRARVADILGGGGR